MSRCTVHYAGVVWSTELLRCTSLAAGVISSATNCRRLRSGMHCCAPRFVCTLSSVGLQHESRQLVKYSTRRSFALGLLKRFLCRRFLCIKTREGTHLVVHKQPRCRREDGYPHGLHSQAGARKHTSCIILPRSATFCVACVAGTRNDSNIGDAQWNATTDSRRCQRREDILTRPSCIAEAFSAVHWGCRG